MFTLPPPANESSQGAPAFAPQTAGTSCSGPRIGRPLGICSEMQLISPFLQVRVLLGLQGLGVSAPADARVLRTPLTLPGGLVSCALACLSQRALKDQGLGFTLHVPFPDPAERPECPTRTGTGPPAKTAETAGVWTEEMGERGVSEEI